jgi:uncharacterized protein (TIRG00374 family)
MLRSPAVRLLGTCAAVALLLHGVDGRGALRSMGAADVSWLAAAVALTVLAYLLAVAEWGVLLRAANPRVAWTRIASWQAQSVFLGSVVPGGAGGDALRMVHAVRVAGRGRGIASLLCSRMAGSCGMAAWGLLGALLLRAQFGAVTVVAALALVLVICCGWAMAWCCGPLLRHLHGRTAGLVRRAATLAMPLTDALHWFRGRPQALGWSVIAGVLGWTVNLLSLVALARAVGVLQGPEFFALVVPLSLLTTLVPFAINGIGLREGVLLGLLVHAGADPHRAGALALLVDLQALPVALAGAALWLGDRGSSRRDARGEEVVAGGGRCAAAPRARSDMTVRLRGA